MQLHGNAYHIVQENRASQMKRTMLSLSASPLHTRTCDGRALAALIDALCQGIAGKTVPDVSFSVNTDWSQNFVAELAGIDEADETVEGGEAYAFLPHGNGERMLSWDQVVRRVEKGSDEVNSEVRYVLEQQTWRSAIHALKKGGI